MKTKLLTAIMAFMNLFAFGQSPEAAEKIMIKLSGLYNKADYVALYGLLSPEFRAHAAEVQITTFFKNNLKQSFGNMLSWKLISKSAGAFNYAVQMEQGELDLKLMPGSNGDIAGMQWLPAKAKEETKKRDASALPSNNPMKTPLQKELDSLVRAFLQNEASCGLSIGLIEDNNTQSYFYGSTNKQYNVLPGSTTLYEIGSVTKTMTGIVLAHAINEGKVKPEDDIRKYLPGEYPNLEYKGKPVRIKHMSNHTSGLPRMPEDFDKAANYDPHDPYAHYTREMMYNYLKTAQLATEPGITSEYSNYSMGLLGLILERVYGKAMEDLVMQYVTIPAGMTHTKFNVPQTEMPNMAKGYNEDGAEAGYWQLGPFNAAGGLKSDMQDMLKYVRANMQEINADFKLSHKSTYTGLNDSIGLNWMISPTNDHKTMIWHNGETGGFSSFAGYIKESNVGIVVLCNSATDAGSIAVTLLRSMSRGKK